METWPHRVEGISFWMGLWVAGTPWRPQKFWVMLGKAVEMGTGTWSSVDLSSRHWGMAKRQNVGSPVDLPTCRKSQICRCGPRGFHPTDKQGCFVSSSSNQALGSMEERGRDS